MFYPQLRVHLLPVTLTCSSMVSTMHRAGLCLLVCPSCSTAVCFIAVVINSAFAVSLAGFLVMHINMLAANCTTIEMYEKERIHPWPYNKGMRRNLEDVFGKR